jgi:putative ABC transport system permease protein
MHRFLRRIHYWYRARRLEADLAEELEVHRAMTQEQLERSGISPHEARVASRRALGNVALAREDARAVWTWPSIDRVSQDVRYGARLLKTHPGFAATAILTLAVGIGATTTVFSVVEAEIWKPLPFPDAHRLVALYTTGPGPSASQDTVSAAEFIDWRSQSRAFEDLAAFRWSARHVLRGRDGPESVRGLPVTPGFFTALRRRPALGRPFGPEDERASRSVILSDGGWRRFFGADPAIVGRSITLDDEAYVVVGVMAADPLEFVPDPDLFEVIDLTSAAARDRDTRDLTVIGRLKSGLDRATAEADLRLIAQRLAREYPAEHAGRGVRVDGLREAYTGWNWRPLFFFLGAALVLLVLSCANVANLLLARAIGRQREFAIRGALGGGRGALVRQLLVEGLLLAVPGAAIGLVLANWALTAVSTWLPPAYVGRGGHFALDVRVLLFAIAAAGVTAIVFGLAPAFVATRRDLSAMLAQGGRTMSGSPAERRARHGLVVAEVTMALVLLVGAGLFLNSFVRLTRMPLGFDPQDRLTMRIAIAGTAYADPRQIVAFSERLIAEVRAVPGVRDAAVGTSVPLDSVASSRFTVAGRPRPAAGEEPRGLVRAISPDYLRTLGIRLVAGRNFTAQDVDGGPAVALINEHLARRFFAGGNPVGQQLVLLRGGTPWVGSGSVQIAGVVSNVKDVGMNEVDFNDIYLPFAQTPAPSIQLIVSTAVPVEGVVDSVRRVVLAADPNLPVTAVKTMAQRADDALRSDRFHLLLIGAFAALAIGLASVGIFGVMACAIEQRTREFGVRLALGADRLGILLLALGQSARLGVAGTLLGLGLSLALARLLGDALYLVQGKHEGLLYGVSTTDPVTLLCACAGLLGVAGLAGLIPARRATRVDPIVALRCE